MNGLIQGLSRHGERLAVATRTEELSYSDLAARVAAVAAERVEAARRVAGAAPGAFPVADGAYALARAIQRLEKADALCERDFCRAPASLRPPPAPRKKKRTRAPARDLAGARRTLGFGDSDEEVDSWTCRECAYPHTSPAEAAMVACAACNVGVVLYVSGMLLQAKGVFGVAGLFAMQALVAQMKLGKLIKKEAQYARAA